MNKPLVFHFLSKALLLGSALFLLPAVISLYYGEKDTVLIFLIVGLCLAICSTPLAILKPKNKTMYAREGLVIVALLWVIYPVIGALPFYFSGEIPNFADALFESFSGFTTTGATILSDIESLSRGMLFWRCFSHWVGGMGVIVLIVAIMPSSNHALKLMQAECTGPKVGKIVSKGRNSAMYLYIIYAVLTLVTVVLLRVGKMPLFDSVCHAMSVAGTGGFSIKNSGIMYYNSAYIEYVVSVMMVIFGINFSLIYFLLMRKFKEVFKNTELKAYFAIILVATLLIFSNIYGRFGNVEETFRLSFFQVTSVMTSTGFATVDFNILPSFSQIILLLVMIVGACAGSTGGGFKVSRVVIMFKSAKKAIRKTLHPKSVNLVKSDEKAIDIDVVHGVHTYLIIYIFLFIVSSVLISLSNVDFTTNFTSVCSCINNCGPGLAKVSSMDNYGFYSSFSKLVLIFDMLLGRLECFPIIILMSPSVWRKKNF